MFKYSSNCFFYILLCNKVRHQTEKSIVTLDGEVNKIDMGKIAGKESVFNNLTG